MHLSHSKDQNEQEDVYTICEPSRGFYPRIIDRYPNTKDFIEQEKQLGQITSPPPRQGFKMVTDTLHRPFPNSLIVHHLLVYPKENMKIISLFLLSFSVDWEDNSNTQNNVWPHLQTLWSPLCVISSNLFPVFENNIMVKDGLMCLISLLLKLHLQKVRRFCICIAFIFLFTTWISCE